MPQEQTISAPAEGETLLSKAQVRARYGGVSDTCIVRWTADPRVRFPPPDTHIKNRGYWRLATLRRFDAERSNPRPDRAPGQKTIAQHGARAISALRWPMVHDG